LLSNFAYKPQEAVGAQGIEADITSDFCFFLGDTNFRFKSTFSEYIDQVKNAPNDIEKLDEFSIIRREHKMYPGFHEAKIEFLPTYKLEKDGDQYVDKKDQCPSYADRILYKVNDKKQSEHKVIAYRSLNEVYGSDHRPIVLETAVKIKTQD